MPPIPPSSITPDIARSIRLFRELDNSALDRLLSNLEPCQFTAGQIILGKEMPPDWLYFVIEGRVRVELDSSNGQIFNLTELKPGDIFGERAILTGEARTANVRAITDVQVARLSRENFEHLLHEEPRVSASLCRDLARQLGTWADRHQREEREHRDVIANLIGWQLLPEFGAFPGVSPAIRALNQRLEQLGGSPSHVLILGEPGTWKDLAARLIHFHGDAARPVLFLDCASPPPVPGQGDATLNDNRSELLQEIAQEAALFGLLPDSAVYARRVRRGMLELANGGDLILRNVDALTPAMQELLADFLKQGRYRRRGDQEWHQSQVRILATSAEHLGERAAIGGFSAPLFQCLSAETIHLAPLRERKKDIPSIARSLLPALNTRHHKQVRRISTEALNALVDHDWPLNGSELYQVVSRAVVVCPDDEILPEHIFLQGQPFEGGRFNLLTLPVVERVARRPDFPRVLRWTTVPLFVAILMYLLTGPARSNAANLAVWTLWWPALLATVLFVARGWCSYCPLEALGELAGAKTRVVKEPPAWLKSWGPTLSLGGLVGIILLEQATGMFSWARATGTLLATLLILTVTADLVLGRRGWCKYLCPLGRIVSLMSRISLLEMHSNRNVCVSRCRVDDCVRERGCPMGLHPTGISNSDHCVLCLNCVRSCPHHAMQMDLRNPALGLYARSSRGLHEALFSLMMVGVIIAAKGTPLLFGRPAEIFPHTRWSMIEFLAGILITLSVPLVVLLLSVRCRKDFRKRVVSISGPAYLPLAFTGLFVIYFRAFVEGGDQLIPWLLGAAGFGRWLDLPRLTPDLGTLRLLIVPLILAGFAFSWFVVGRIYRQQLSGQPGLAGHRVLMVLAAALFLVLL